MSDRRAGTLEYDLAALEADAEAVGRRLSELLRDVKKIRALATNGLVRDLRRAIQALPERADLVAEDLRKLKAEADIDVTAIIANGSFARELIESARAAGVSMEEQDGRLLCYPSVIQVSASDELLIIDKKRERRLRPSVVVAMLKARQDKPPAFKPDAFLESLERAYDLQVAAQGREAGSVVKVGDLHRVLTLLPTQRKEYPEPDFARDLYLLDQSGVVEAKDGRRLSFSASALTRGKGVMSTVTKTGQHKIYAGLSFS